jgi:hypothetical protein
MFKENLENFTAKVAEGMNKNIGDSVGGQIVLGTIGLGFTILGTVLSVNLEKKLKDKQKETESKELVQA